VTGAATSSTTRPLVIEAAVNGATSRRRQPHTPRTPAEVTADALACFEAGAAIVHNHTDDAVLGHPTGRHASEPYLEAWRPVLELRPDAILYPTMAGGGGGRRIEDRYAHVVELHGAGVLGLAVADPGTVNLTGRRADGTVAPVTQPYENSPADIDWMFRWCREHEVGVHVSIFEPGFLRLVLGHLDAGTLPPRAKLQLYLSGPTTYFGLPAEPWALDAYLTLLGDAPLPWMVGVPGGDVVASGLAAMAIGRGGHVRVGLEDYGGDATPTNAELVTDVAALARAAGRPVATPTQARAELGLPAQPQTAGAPGSG
jgi:uncharacterized protein (DUF849 family)